VNVARQPAELSEARRAVAVGTFDGVHKGHLRVIETARNAGLRTGVVTFDPHPRAVLGGDVELLATLQRRLELFEEAGLEDVLVLRFDEQLASLSATEFAERMLRGIGAETVAVGETFRFGHGREGDLALLERLGFDVRRVPLLENVSSSRIRQLVHAGDTEHAATLLGRPPEVEGIVVRGDGRGRELGFPTANVGGIGQLLPPPGVYACRAEVDGAGRRAVANYGTKPTFGPDGKPVLEVHVLDFSGDLYGKAISVGTFRHLRDERKFESLEALKAQIAADAAKAREI